ncbi:MAG TPA: hypothetical protein VG755_24670 [Nannocystaceae bacterium]|nr:hypothetical protein [Nannocystaceae bacterium]
MRGWLVAIVVVAACDDAPRPSPPVPVAIDPEARARDAFLGDRGFRREALERSLVNPDNGYSRDRLAGYALADTGWDLLPVWNPRSVPMTRALVEQLREGALRLPEDAAPLVGGDAPDDWAALGERVFFELPLRRDDALAAALLDAARAESLGLFMAADGTYPGLVAFEDTDGSTRVGITCALCHAAKDGDSVRAGRARRTLDYGTARLDHQARTRDPIPASLADRMQRWGPGRADITGDDDEDPVAIPDLWRVLELATLTQAGTLRLADEALAADERRAANLVVLAIRQETQIIQAAGERTRPPRELAWALASYVAALAPPTRPPTTRALAQRGEQLFASHCDRCHRGPNLGGASIDAAKVGTDRALADSRARGTGNLRVAPLLAVAAAAPYFHDGTVPTLDAVLDPARLAADYRGGVRGPGAIAGHAFGTDLPAADREALVVFLATL